jgi:hypothetical protein
VYYATYVPFLQCCLERPGQSERISSAKMISMTNRMLNDKIVDFVLIDREKAYIGSQWAIYLSVKINSNKRLSERQLFISAPDSSSLSTATAMIERLKEEMGGRMLSLRSDRRTLRHFLSECDKKMLVRYGEEEMSRVVAPLGVSLRNWLSVL